MQTEQADDSFEDVNNDRDDDDNNASQSSWRNEVASPTPSMSHSMAAKVI